MSGVTTYQSISVSLLEDLLEPIINEIVLESLNNEQILRIKYGNLSNRWDIYNNNTTSFNTTENNGTGNGSTNGNTLAGSANGTPGPSNSNSSSNNNIEYFQCLNCDRRIAGSRFAAHIDKCLGGRTRK
ncbi:hypothetical protein PACTADRAFT_52068 [Pachysolen tannophilus NRRL Y-2460]|uniref:SAGA-associated factor 11 n=1 Tax=Pachysolen tannophilus NRRL Y-2460 TaxID=669874 RepID=A0A1E4TP51_PACTA|nr:hypothetical protein PACTADRAFT_52068 [Pachysolen tannophilus NRRL Y-2460]